MSTSRLDTLFDPKRLDHRWALQPRNDSRHEVRVDTATQLVTGLRGEARAVLGDRAEVMDGFITRLEVTLTVWEEDHDPAHLRVALAQLSEIEDLLEAWLLWQRR